MHGRSVLQDIHVKTEEIVQETLERLGGVHGVIGIVSATLRTHPYTPFPS